MRAAISAAPVLVKVRHKIFSGRAPSNNSLAMRSTSTRVLPVPALADTQTLRPGSAARLCWAVRLSVGVGACLLIRRLPHRRYAIP